MGYMSITNTYSHTYSSVKRQSCTTYFASQVGMTAQWQL